MATVVISGYLGADPEIKSISDKTTLSVLKIAESRSIKKGDQWENVTDWFRVKAWMNLSFLGKGDMITVTGKIVNANYQKDGKTVYQDDIIVNDFKDITRLKKAESSNSLSTKAEREFADATNDLPF